jgi:hypothetical protein
MKAWTVYYIDWGGVELDQKYFLNRGTAINYWKSQPNYTEDYICQEIEVVEE